MSILVSAYVMETKVEWKVLQSPNDADDNIVVSPNHVFGIQLRFVESILYSFNQALIVAAVPNL